MNKFSFGLKLSAKYPDLLPDAATLINLGVFDYIEIGQSLNADIRPFKEYAVPFVIHAAYNNPDLISLKDDAILWADKLNAEKIIFHPYMLFMGYKVPTSYDERILIENMPRIGTDGKVLYGHTPAQMKKMLSDKFGFCLDINHVLKTSVSLKGYYQPYLMDFMKFSPKMYHLSDGNLTNHSDEHLPLGSGNYPIQLLKKHVVQYSGCKSHMITFETVHPLETKLHGAVSDIRNFMEV